MSGNQGELFEALRGLYSFPVTGRDPASGRCSVCGGDDQASPCAYPGEGRPGCLRAARLATSSTGLLPGYPADSEAAAAAPASQPIQTYCPSVDGYPEPSTMMRGRLVTARAVKEFATAGHAILTVRSLVSGEHYTYKVSVPKDPGPYGRRQARPIWFVKVLTGPDNNRCYSYLGQVRHDYTYDHGRKSQIATSDPRAEAFAWIWPRVRMEQSAELFARVEIWHEGRCGRCGRRLTVPESIESGFGPECIQVVQGGRS